MQLIGITIRKDISDLLPKDYLVGREVIIEEPTGVTVESIKFYETGYNSGRYYRGRCYVISFVGSAVKRVVPAEYVVEVVVEAGENKAVLPK